MKELLKGLLAFCLLPVTLTLVVGIFLVGWIAAIVLLLLWCPYRAYMKCWYRDERKTN